MGVGAVQYATENGGAMKDPAIQFYCNDWLSSPTVMSMEPLEELAYFRMLLFMWQSGDCSIPNDAERMAKLTRTDVNTCSIVFEQAMNNHPTEPNRLTNTRLFRQWTERQEFRKAKSEAGKRSGEARRKQRKPEPPKDNEQTGTRVQFRSNETRTKSNPSSSSSSSSSSSNTIYTPGDGIVIPDRINTPSIVDAMGRWIAHINADDTHKSIEPNSPQEDAAWRLVASWRESEESTVAAIDAAIAGQWSNLRKPEAPKQRSNGKPKGKDIMDFLDERIEEEQRSEQF